MSDDLIVTARRLARANLRRPRQADLKRAISTAYYALFHALARQCADLFIGVGQVRSDQAWSHVYRALEHGFAKNACNRARSLSFPPEIVFFADSFVLMQEERHRADYDPDARFNLGESLLLILICEHAIASLKKASRRDRRAFTALVLLKRR